MLSHQHLLLWENCKHLKGVNSMFSPEEEVLVALCPYSFSNGGSPLQRVPVQRGAFTVGGMGPNPPAPFLQRGHYKKAQFIPPLLYAFVSLLYFYRLSISLELRLQEEEKNKLREAKQSSHHIYRFVNLSTFTVGSTLMQSY